jgi:transcriptional regulator with XRE-family HTH domain
MTFRHECIPLQANYAGAADTRLGSVLKRCRTRISPDRSSLGTFLRLPARVGKAATQEEVAEAAGVSRQWYMMMENDRAVRVSASVLARIADVLMMDAAERAELFRIGVPELRSTPPIDRASSAVEALQSLLPLMRRLSSADTAAEVMALVCEHAMCTLAPNAMITCSSDDSAEQIRATIRRRWGDGAGKDPSWISATVRAHGGFFAKICAVHFSSHEYSEVERAQLGGLAELASLVISLSKPASSRDLLFAAV